MVLTLHKLSSLTFLQPNRKKVAKSTSKTLIEEWKNRFTLVPNDIAKKKLENTTQMEIKIDIDNRSMLRCHYKVRFLFFKFS